MFDPGAQDTERERLRDLAAEIGKPRTSWSVDDLESLFRESRVRGLSLMHVGGDGLPKRLDFVPRDSRQLREIVGAGERADGSSLFPDSGIPAGASDVLLRPRLSTGFLDPFSEIPTLVLLCGHERPDGSPLPQSPDTIVRRAAARLESATGYGLEAFGEVEYFLGRRGDDVDVPEGADRGYHACAPHVFGEAMRRRALLVLVDMGVPVRYAHAEVGRVEPEGPDDLLWEQHEIELAPAPLPEAADAIVLTRWVLRSLARRAGFRFSVDPILAEGHAGNGLHVHFTPTRAGERVAVTGPDGGLSEPARWLIGGLVRRGSATMAFGNRGAGSLLRLSQAKEAPSAITWAALDRSALVRLPAQARPGEGGGSAAGTIEFRLPDGSARPHLLLAGVVASMVEAAGAEDLEDLLAATGGTGADRRARPVPRSPGEIADALEDARSVFAAEDAIPSGIVDRALRSLRAVGQEDR